MDHVIDFLLESQLLFIEEIELLWALGQVASPFAMKIAIGIMNKAKRIENADFSYKHAIENDSLQLMVNDNKVIGNFRAFYPYFVWFGSVKKKKSSKFVQNWLSRYPFLESELCVVSFFNAMRLLAACLVEKNQLKFLPKCPFCFRKLIKVNVFLNCVPGSNSCLAERNESQEGSISVYKISCVSESAGYQCKQRYNCISLGGWMSDRNDPLHDSKQRKRKQLQRFREQECNFKIYLV